MLAVVAQKKVTVANDHESSKDESMVVKSLGVGKQSIDVIIKIVC